MNSRVDSPQYVEDLCKLRLLRLFLSEPSKIGASRWVHVTSNMQSRVSLIVIGSGVVL